MELTDTLLANLFLGKLSRDAVGYSNTVKGQDPDHTWSSFKKTDAAFRATYPDLAPALNEFMRAAKEKQGDNFVEAMKLRALALFVQTQTDLLS